MSRDVEPIPKVYRPPKDPKPLRRSGRLAPMSKKRRSQLDARAQVRAEVHARDVGCVARDVVPEVACGSPWPHRPRLEVDERIPRGRWSRSWLMPEHCQLLCQVHHDWVDLHDDLATERGLRAPAPPIERPPRRSP